jgi:hypothetical protein
MHKAIIVQTEPWLVWARNHISPLGQRLSLWLIGAVDFAQADTGLHGVWWPAQNSDRTARDVLGLSREHGFVKVHCTGPMHSVESVTLEDTIIRAKPGPHVPLLSIWLRLRDVAATQPVPFLQDYNRAIGELDEMVRNLPDTQVTRHLTTRIRQPPDPVLLRRI